MRKVKNSKNIKNPSVSCYWQVNITNNILLFGLQTAAKLSVLYVSVFVYVSVCVCVCVKERAKHVYHLQLPVLN